MLNFFKTALLSVLVLSVASCSKSDEFKSDIDEPVSILKVLQSDGTTTFVNPNICPVLEATDPLTADEIEFLYAMREDEKLTKDLYKAFALQYPTSIQFSRISVAEESHILAIETVLNYYEITFPKLGENGVFLDQDRQSKYNELLAKGATVVGAFEVMALMEEESVAAYAAVEKNTTNANIKLLVSNMIKASSNHLKAAIRQLTNLGIKYVPSVLDQNTFDAIIGSSFVEGNHHGQQKGKGHHGGNTNSQKGNKGQGNKGNVNGSGSCTNTANGSTSGNKGGKGQAGKGYRGGK